MNNLTLRPLQKYDFRMVYYNGKWEILPATYEVEQIMNLMSKDGTYEKCLKNTFKWWGDSLKDEDDWDDSLMRCVRDHLANELNAKIKIHTDV